VIRIPDSFGSSPRESDESRDRDAAAQRDHVRRLQAMLRGEQIQSQREAGRAGPQHGGVSRALKAGPSDVPRAPQQIPTLSEHARPSERSQSEAKSLPSASKQAVLARPEGGGETSDARATRLFPSPTTADGPHVPGLVPVVHDAAPNANVRKAGCEEAAGAEGEPEDSQEGAGTWPWSASGLVVRSDGEGAQSRGAGGGGSPGDQGQPAASPRGDGAAGISISHGVSAAWELERAKGDSASVATACNVGVRDAVLGGMRIRLVWVGGERVRVVIDARDAGALDVSKLLEMLAEEGVCPEDVRVEGVLDQTGDGEHSE